MKESNRLIEFDYIRVAALIGILICHSCFIYGDIYSRVGRYFSTTFNFLFLILSAFLLGFTWKKRGYPQYDSSFLTGRIRKLSQSYYPYLAILFLFLYLSEGYLSIKNIITHLLYLPWFDKINGYGHLWFMTMIVICYFGCWLLSRFQTTFFKRNSLIYSILLIGSICVDYIATKHGLPGYMFPYLTGYIFIFSYSSKITTLITRIPTISNWMQFILVNVFGILMFTHGIFESNCFVAYLIGMLCAISVFIFMYKICRSFHSSQFIIWLSGISFEIYLVHEFFLGKYNVYSIFQNPIAGFLLLMILSVMAAVFLKFIARKVVTTNKIHIKTPNK